MKMCRMLRVETRDKLYDVDRKFYITDILSEERTKLTFKPEYDPIGFGPFTHLKFLGGGSIWPLYESEDEELKRVSHAFAHTELPPKRNGEWTWSHLPPVYWTHPRPGPIEDPLLREHWLDSSFEDRVHSVFGFSDMETLKTWFSCDIQLEWMTKNGYGISEYKSKNIKHGLRQSVMLVNQPYKLLRFEPLTKYAER